MSAPFPHVPLPERRLLQRVPERLHELLPVDRSVSVQLVVVRKVWMSGGGGGGGWCSLWRRVVVCGGKVNYLSSYPILACIYRWAFAAFLRLVPDAKRRLRQMTAGRLRTLNSASK